LEVPNSAEVAEFLQSSFKDVRTEVVGERIHVFTHEPKGVFTKILKKFSLKEAVIRDANLEDVFLKLTGRRLRE